MSPGRSSHFPVHTFYTVSTLSSEGLLFIQGRVRDHRRIREPHKLIPLSLQISLMKLLLHSLHRKYLHAGINTLMATIGHTYHIAGLRNHLKKLSRQCPTCQRSYNHGVQQQMGLLPITRTSPSPPFAITGLDFAGPFTIKRGHTRRPTKLKSYACLFVCMATKAVHIELCADLTTDKFLPVFAPAAICGGRGVWPEMLV